jgi:hypothetical protein
MNRINSDVDHIDTRAGDGLTNASSCVSPNCINKTLFISAVDITLQSIDQVK